MSLTVVIPCYNGGELFKCAVKSLASSGLDYSRLIVSFNGVQDDLNTWLENEYLESNVIVDVICYKKILLAKDHMAKLSEYIFAKYGNISLMLMAHDDVLISSFYKNLCLESVVFPNYGDGRNLLFSGDISDFNFFKASFADSMYTNMSGMIISSKIFKSACSYNKYKKTGSRFEHMLALNRHCKKILFSDGIKVIINERADSDGALIKGGDSRSDELKYFQYYYRNKELNSFYKKYIYFSLYLKKVISYLLHGLVKK